MYKSLLASLPEDLNFEIIFINDFSSDETKDWLFSLDSPVVRFSSNLENFGYAKSNNIGVKNSRGNLLCFLNNDLLFKPGWLTPMLTTYNSLIKNCGILGNIQYRISDDEIDHLGVEFTLKGQFEHIKFLDKKNNKLTNRVFVITGACFIMSRSLFEEAGGFNESYVNGCEDFDLCLKVRSLGKEILVDLSSEVYHHVGLTRGFDNLLNEKNSRYLFQAWRLELKNELFKKWIIALTDNSSDLTVLIDGTLNDKFKLTPNNAARIISENIMAMHENRWAKMIDGIDFNENIERELKFKGLNFIKSHNCYFVGNDASLTIASNIKSIVNFYICGRRIDINNCEHIALTIRVNNIQHKTIELSTITPNINEGIIAPILIHGLPNIFTFKFNYFDPISKELKGIANTAIYISHFVIDEKVIHAN